MRKKNEKQQRCFQSFIVLDVRVLYFFSIISSPFTITLTQFLKVIMITTTKLLYRKNNATSSKKSSVWHHWNLTLFNTLEMLL